MSNRYGLEIRAAGKGDVPALCDLLASLGRPVAAASVTSRLDALRADDGTVLLAASWGPLSGLVALHRYRTFAADRPVAVITVLGVAPDERRRGIGRLLLKAASQASRVAGCGTLELLVPADAVDLQAFCGSTGFTGTGHLRTRTLRKKAGY